MIPEHFLFEEFLRSMSVIGKNRNFEGAEFKLGQFLPRIGTSLYVITFNRWTRVPLLCPFEFIHHHHFLCYMLEMKFL